MYTLGINAAFHDSSAVLVHDGRLVAAAEEERFSRIKHAKRPVPFSAWELPWGAMDYCLREAGLHLHDVDHVAYAFDPALFPDAPAAAQGIRLPLEPSRAATTDPMASPWDPLFVSYVVNAPRQLADGAPHHLQARFTRPGGIAGYAWHFVPHHAAHEASAYLAAPYETMAVMTIDGRGERATTTLGHFDGERHRRLRTVEVPHSLGLLYEAVTRHLGFQHASDEYKVMALGAFGRPRYRDRFEQRLRVTPNGFESDGSLLERDFGPPRRPGAPLEQRHYDIAASLQVALEATTLSLAGWLRDATGERVLALAGGVALNCLMSARLRDSGLFEHVWVQPAAGDAGTALGAALLVDREARGARAREWRMEHAYYGPGYTDLEIEETLAGARVPYRRMDHCGEEAARLLVEGRIIGWFQGRMEFGPRALGARSILASPLEAAMHERLNRLKDREDFRPVAPVVLEEACADWFEPASACPSPFMTFTHHVRGDRADRIPAVRHIDGTARVQTIHHAHNPRYHDVIAAFGRATGVPVLVNTSFNTRGLPIVCSPRDALEAFWTSPIDALVIGRFLVVKPESIP